MKVAKQSKAFLCVLACMLLALNCRGGLHAELGDRDQERSLMHDGYERSYILHIPPSPDEARALVFVLHGGSGEPRGMMGLVDNRFNELADEHNFMVVYPAGYEKHWNDGRIDLRAEASQLNLDDVGFLRKIIQNLGEEFPSLRVRDRVFSTGISNGGLMSYRLACEAPEIRAIAPVTAQLSEELASTCQPSHPVGVAIFNGTEDPLVPYEGGPITVLGAERGNVISTRDTIEFFRSHNRCGPFALNRNLPDNDPEDETQILLSLYSGCQGGVEVRLYRVEGGGHTWPGGKQYLGEFLVGRTSQDLVAADEIWSFFARHL